MFEWISYGYSNTLWAVSTAVRSEVGAIKSLSDPGTFLSGALAGGAARFLTLPIDNGGAKGVKRTVLRRMPQMGCLMMFYTYNASNILPGTDSQPRTKMAATFIIAACAGFNMRFVCNPLTRIGDEKLRTGKSTMDTIRFFKSKTILQFWYCAPNLMANALYCGVLLTSFEGLRRFSERNFRKGDSSSISSNVGNAITNFACGGVAAGFASTVCYPHSGNRYLQTVIHDSSLCRGLMPTLRKEVPQVAIALGIFTLLQPYLSPHHGKRCGFGY